MTADVPESIEVGASNGSGDLRLWKAREGVREGEARLSAQTVSRTSMEARATAITGWAAAALVVAVSAAVATQTWPSRLAAGTTGFALFLAAVSCIHAARPRDWGMTGYDPTVITADKLGTELEVVESIAKGLSPAIQDNNRRLEQMGLHLRRAGWMLIGAPMMGLIAYVAAWFAISP